MATPDPVLNCASGACCHPGSPEQLAAMVKTLCGNGCPEEHAGPLAKNMLASGTVLFPAHLAAALGDFVLNRT